MSSFMCSSFRTEPGTSLRLKECLWWWFLPINLLQSWCFSYQSNLHTNAIDLSKESPLPTPCHVVFDFEFGISLFYLIFCRENLTFFVVKSVDLPLCNCPLALEHVLSHLGAGKQSPIFDLHLKVISWSQFQFSSSLPGFPWVWTGRACCDGCAPGASDRWVYQEQPRLVTLSTRMLAAHDLK